MAELNGMPIDILGQSEEQIKRLVEQSPGKVSIKFADHELRKIPRTFGFGRITEVFAEITGCSCVFNQERKVLEFTHVIAK